MTKEEWRKLLVAGFDEALQGSTVTLDAIAEQLAQEDQAKQLLRDAGFGCTGVNLLLTVQEAVAWMAGAHNPADGSDGT